MTEDAEPSLPPTRTGDRQAAAPAAPTVTAVYRAACVLCAAGVDTVKELKYRNPANLAKALADANKKRKLVRVLPSEKLVARWIECAKGLELMIRY